MVCVVGRPSRTLLKVDWAANRLGGGELLTRVQLASLHRFTDPMKASNQTSRKNRRDRESKRTKTIFPRGKKHARRRLPMFLVMLFVGLITISKFKFFSPEIRVEKGRRSRTARCERKTNKRHGFVIIFMVQNVSSGAHERRNQLRRVTTDAMLRSFIFMIIVWMYF